MISVPIQAQKSFQSELLENRMSCKQSGELVKEFFSHHHQISTSVAEDPTAGTAAASTCQGRFAVCVTMVTALLPTASPASVSVEWNGNGPLTPRQLRKCHSDVIVTDVDCKNPFMLGYSSSLSFTL